MMNPRGWSRLLLTVVGLVMRLPPTTHAAPPIGALKQFRVPTANSSPFHITQGSDGNFWFTEGFINPPQGSNHNIGRVTPAGDITEFLVCLDCFPDDIVQGPNNILYFTKSDPALGRITTSGEVLSDIPMPNSLANGNGIAASGNDIWIATFNVNSLWRYNVVSGVFTEFPVPTPAATPYDIAVGADGTVWFTEFGGNKIGRLNPVTGVITETLLDADANGPRGIAIATDGKVWFTKRFSNVVGFLDPLTSGVTEFQLASGTGPEGIAAAPDGSVWFAQSVAGNIARITATGAITETRNIKGSEPFGIMIAPSGDPWFTELSANKIAVFQLK